MQISVQCQYCGGILQVPATAAGNQIQCSGCGNLLTVPHQSARAASAPPQKPAPQQYAAPAQQASGRRSGSGLLIGCVVTLAVIGVLAVGGYFAVRQIKRKVEDVVNQVSGVAGMIEGLEQLGNVEEIIREYEANGYEKIESQVIKETSPINNKRLYICQMLDIKSDVNDDIAILAQSATIRGTVKGDLDFGGQLLTIEEDAVIQGNLHSRLAQMIIIKGVVEGKLSGGYQALDADPDRIEGGTEGAKRAIDSFRSVLLDRDKKKDRELASLDLKDAQVRSVAKRIIGADNFIRRNEGLKELAKLPPNDDDRAAVVRLLKPYLTDNQSKREAFETYKVWGDKNHTSVLIEVIKSDPRRAESYYVDLLVQWDARDAVLQLINHNDSRIASRANRALSGWEIADEDIARQCLQDLPELKKATFPEWDELFKRIESLKIEDEQLKSEISRNLILLIPSIRGSSDQQALLRALKQNVGPGDAESLVKYQGRFGGASETTYFETLLASQSPSTNKYIADAAIGNSSVAERILLTRGKEDGEPFLWPHLKAKAFTTRKKACKLLEKIGTEKSIPHLQPLQDDSLTQVDAKRAISEIQRRQAAAKP